MVSFGERLKKEREKRGMTLEEVSAATKIGVRSLRALEQEKFDLLPGGIFNKGFVRAYAKHLGLDDEVVVSDYMEAAGESSPAPTLAEPTAANTAQESRAPGSSQPLPWGSMAIVVVVGTLLFAAWYYYSHRKIAQSTDATETAVTSSTNSSVPSPATTSPASASGTAQEGAPGTRSAAVAAPTATAGTGSFELSLRAVDKVWVSTTVDAQTPSEAIMEQGQSKTLHASGKVVMRVGNPTALQVSMNGKRVAIRGVEGQPETLTFTASGLQLVSSSPATPN